MTLVNHEELLLNLEDNEWPLTTIDHDRMIFYIKCDRDVKVEVNFHFLYHIY